MSAGSVTTVITVEVFKPSTKLRTGGIRAGSPVIHTLDPDHYTAIHQCLGEEVTEDGDTNNWWVKIETPYGEGWVNGTTIRGGNDNERIKDVPVGSTVFL